MKIVWPWVSRKEADFWAASYRHVNERFDNCADNNERLVRSNAILRGKAAALESQNEKLNNECESLVDEIFCLKQKLAKFDRRRDPITGRIVGKK
ncbi:MAG: hypothetical protein EOM21_18765 [Gammaproteobacteria bacterium]|nr:hypothetical protein [Gammaproteobacteria bacterium]